MIDPLELVGCLPFSLLLHVLLIRWIPGTPFVSTGAAFWTGLRLQSLHSLSLLPSCPPKSLLSTPTRSWQSAVQTGMSNYGDGPPINLPEQARSVPVQAGLCTR